MFDQIKKVLVLAAHPDDAEFGLGGTITKLKEEGKEIHIATFSDCDESTPHGFEVGSILKEFYNSCKFLGIPETHISVFDFPVRHFPKYRQEILEELVKLKNSYNPDLVFLPSSSDIHQDHQTIHEEGIRAFKFSCLLGYEMPWNNFGFTSFVFVNLDKNHIQKKIDALNHYQSQKSRNYSNDEFVKSLAILRGGQIQKKYAESFELIRFTHF